MIYSRELVLEVYKLLKKHTKLVLHLTDGGRLFVYVRDPYARSKFLLAEVAFISHDKALEVLCRDGIPPNRIQYKLADPEVFKKCAQKVMAHTIPHGEYRKVLKDWSNNA